MFSVKFVLIFILSLSQVYGSCDFDSKFADAYVKARKKYADSLHYQREQADRNKKPSSGFFRAKKFGASWKSVNVKEHVAKMFGNSDVVIEPRMGGKIFIFSKKKELNSRVIVFDPSGDYFRVIEPTIRNGRYIADKDTRHFGLNGEELKRPSGMSERQWRDYDSENTHFKAEF